MSNLILPGAGILFMKVGTHAREPLGDIIARKQREIAEAGYALWGYGGGTCHPQTMVQPFGASFEKKGRTIYLCMEEVNSNHFADPVRADQYSPDGFAWTDIPSPINVLGSRFALVIKDLHQEEFELPLSHTQVALGNTRGRPGNLYVRGRVDKACLEVVDGPQTGDSMEKTVRIGLVAEVKRPFAVFLRNRR